MNIELQKTRTREREVPPEKMRGMVETKVADSAAKLENRRERYRKMVEGNMPAPAIANEAGLVQKAETEVESVNRTAALLQCVTSVRRQVQVLIELIETDAALARELDALPRNQRNVERDTLQTIIIAHAVAATVRRVFPAPSGEQVERKKLLESELTSDLRTLAASFRTRAALPPAATDPGNQGTAS